MIEPKYPLITVALTGMDGNAFSILGRVRSAMKQGKVKQEDIDAFFKEATNSDYDNLVQVVMKYVTVV